MSNKLAITMLATILLSPAVFAQNSDKSSGRITYKCHLTLQDRSEVVHQFVTVEQNKSDFENGLKGSMVFFADGVSGSKIESIYECAKLSDRFKTKTARDLEAKTPF